MIIAAGTSGPHSASGLASAPIMAGMDMAADRMPTTMAITTSMVRTMPKSTVPTTAKTKPCNIACSGSGPTIRRAARTLDMMENAILVREG